MTYSKERECSTKKYVITRVLVTKEIFRLRLIHAGENKQYNKQRHKLVNRYSEWAVTRQAQARDECSNKQYTVISCTLTHCSHWVAETEAAGQTVGSPH